MLFITNRYPKQSIRTRIGRKFDFNLDNNDASNSVFFCERSKAGSYTEIGSIELLRRLKECKHRQLLIYIHGFSSLPEDVFESAGNFQKLCDRAGKNEVKVIPLVWPCDKGLGVVDSYWSDQKAADKSAFSYARVLQKFITWRNSDKHNTQDDPCLKRINILSHSMGNRVLRQTLAAWDKYDLADGVPLIFRSTFMLAADLVNESLERGEGGELICHSSRNVVVYYASDDLALRASKAANLTNSIASRRLGHSGPENMDNTPKNVYSIDCDDVNTDYDTPVGHSYFLYNQSKTKPGKVFNHIFETIRQGRVFPADESRRTTIIIE